MQALDVHAAAQDASSSSGRDGEKRREAQPSAGTADARVDVAHVGPPASGGRATWLSTGYHNVTAMVGAGVLGLPYAFAALGWAGGTVVLLVSLLISMYSFALLVHLHEGGPGHRFCRYHDLCQHAWGEKRGAWVLLSLQVPYLFGLAVTYTVTGGESLGAFVSLLHTLGGSSSPSLVLPLAAWIGAFSAVELLLSQLPNLDSLAWVSSIGAAMSICYSLGASFLSLRSIRPRDEVDFTPGAGGGADHGPLLQQFMGMTSAITTIFFAYGGHSIALEIQATLPFPPTTVRPMMIGVHSAFALTFICYTLASTTGYYAFGSAAKANVLASVDPSPLWLLAACNLGVVLHVLASYQVYSNVLLQLLDHWVEYLLARCSGTQWSHPAAIDAAGAAGARGDAAPKAPPPDADLLWVPTPAPGLLEMQHRAPSKQGAFSRVPLEPDAGTKVDRAAVPRVSSRGLQAARQGGSVGGVGEPQLTAQMVSGPEHAALDFEELKAGGDLPGCAACLEHGQDHAEAGVPHPHWQAPSRGDQSTALCASDQVPPSQLLAPTTGPSFGPGQGPSGAKRVRKDHISVSRLLRRVALRMVYVSATCLLACLIPFFGQLMGLIGALGSTPTNFILPCLLWLSVRRPTAWRSVTWWLCWVVTVAGVLVGLLGAAGAIYGIVQASGSYRLFGQ